jgi:hypothetical protein
MATTKRKTRSTKKITGKKNFVSLQDRSLLFSSWPAWTQNTVIVILAGLILFFTMIRVTLGVVSDFKKTQMIERPEPIRHTMTISGKGKIMAGPDIAVLNLGLRTKGDTVIEAQTKNNKVFNELVGEIKKLGIEQKDIQTEQYRINSIYDWEKPEREVVGYEAVQSVKVKVREIDKVNKVLKVAGEKGATEVSGPSFTIDDARELEKQARLKAFENAKDKAKSIAHKANKVLGDIITFNESSITPSPVYASKEGYGRGGDSPQIEKGRLEVSATVTITFEMLNRNYNNF